MPEGGYKNMFDQVIMSPPKKVLNKSGMTNGPLLQNYFDLITADMNKTRMRPSRRRTVNI